MKIVLRYIPSTQKNYLSSVTKYFYFVTLHLWSYYMYSAKHNILYSCSEFIGTAKRFLPGTLYNIVMHVSKTNGYRLQNTFPTCGSTNLTPSGSFLCSRLTAAWNFLYNNKTYIHLVIIPDFIYIDWPWSYCINYWLRAYLINGLFMVDTI